MHSEKQSNVAEIMIDDEELPGTEKLLVTPVGPNLYCLEQSSVLGEMKYHDIIEAEPQADGVLRFLRVVTPSGLKTVSWLLPESRFASKSLLVLLDRVVAVGGNWERIFGGFLILHLPPIEESSILSAFNALF